MKGWQPQPTLRQKREINMDLSGRELFVQLPLSDMWGDAKLVEVYRYLRQNTRLKIPNGWDTVIEDFDRELDRANCKPNP